MTGIAGKKGTARQFRFVVVPLAPLYLGDFLIAAVVISAAWDSGKSKHIYRENEQKPFHGGKYTDDLLFMQSYYYFSPSQYPVIAVLINIFLVKLSIVGLLQACFEFLYFASIEKNVS